MNKFPIIPSHFILATKVNKAQTAVLEEEDLGIAYECLKAWGDVNGGQERRLYGFFNSGPHSGASQAHRHLQFVPVEGMREGDPFRQWGVLMDQVVDKGANLPVEVFWEHIPSQTLKEGLHAIYNRLYKQALEAAKRYAETHPGSLELHESSEGVSPFSYNLGITAKAMTIIPRRKEGTILRKDDGREVGFAALNGTVLAGTMMVKREEEWNLLQAKQGLLDEVLEGIGIPIDNSGSTKI